MCQHMYFFFWMHIHSHDCFSVCMQVWVCACILFLAYRACWNENVTYKQLKSHFFFIFESFLFLLTRKGIHTIVHLRLFFFPWSCSHITSLLTPQGSCNIIFREMEIESSATGSIINIGWPEVPHRRSIRSSYLVSILGSDGLMTQKVF